MASCYGPIFVSTCPLLVFKRNTGEGDEAAEGWATNFRGCSAGWTLVATGSLANVEPDRIMLKKVSGFYNSLTTLHHYPIFPQI